VRAGALAISTPAQMLLEDRQSGPVGPADLLGDSAAAVSLRDAVQRAARAPFPVLIEGASGPQPHANFIEVFSQAPVG
jgi:DNA-binding NtrC family response regulator